MAELLFEIFCEEIPARMQVRAGEDLSKALEGGLKKAGLTVEGAQVLTGPRRLVFTADVPARSPDISEERKGPRVGAPEQALAGFLRGAGLTDISQAQTRSDPKKGEYYVAVIEKSGEETGEILKALIPEVMTNFPWPKSMKSGSSAFRWVRPLQSMICLLGWDVIPVEVGGITAGNSTEGHRRHGRGPFKVKSFADYQKTLEGKGHVVISADARKELIITDARKACAAMGLELVEDEGLLNEVAGLAEWPVVILGDMDPSFLELPAEVIRLSMRTHQKYFAVRDPKTGSLAPNFIVVANQAAPDGGKEIAKGNSKVLSARLSDAQFFQSEDAKKKLIDYYDKLDTVVFHKKLGSIRDKAERVAALAKELAPKVGADAAKAEQAARLAKCDLVTQTVVEFTSLQGQIGAQMYLNEGGDKDIADAIEQHYKPQGPSDSVPTEATAVTVALADKVATLFDFFAIAKEEPTGSKDPYALRRAGLGVLRLEVDNKLNVSPRWLFETYAELAYPSLDYKTDYASSIDRLEIFLQDRLENLLKSQGHRYDTIEAVFSADFQGGVGLSHYMWRERALALQEFLSTTEGEDLLAGYKRAANILKAEAKKGDLPSGAPEKPSAAESLALYEALQAAGPKIEKALESEDYTAAMSQLAILRAPIDAFFTHVQVISDDTAVKENNLRLLLRIRDTAQRIADLDAVSAS